ncbi:unnamed protein product [Cuscuta epithymum]|uniref:F-box domain-containing protein n=1 Tax=Cuscuta epithymum TaxID=186058 RepID=A0AAV0GDH9_9ASTE|nr:unnamed protein product [Cuscuta epithymum]
MEPGRRRSLRRRPNKIEKVLKDGNNDGYSTPLLPNDMILEILKRLPAKSLMRFKCVSKGWLNMILHPFLIESHQNHARTRPDASHRLFAYDQCDKLLLSYHYHDHPDLLIHTIFSTKKNREFQRISNIANGLICVYIYDIGCRGKRSLWLINLATMQKRSLPIPRLCCSQTSIYFLGFDSSSKNYKVLHFCHGKEYHDYHCQVLTLGRRRWRRVVGPNPGKELVADEAMSTDGRIYFKMGNKDLHVLPFFDLHTEKFEHLSVPEASIHREGPVGWHYDDPYYYQEILEIRGKLGLIRELKVWILEETGWIEKSIILPNHVYNATTVGHESNSKIILKSSQGISYYLYDLDTPECREAPGITMHDFNFRNYLLGSNLSSDVCSTKFFNYIENITTL